VSDRLDELRRKRNLLREQLGALDRDITALEAAAEPVAREPRTPDSPEAAPGIESADAILDEFRQQPSSVARRAKLGCVIYFAAALALLALAVAAVYFRARATRGH